MKDKQKIKNRNLFKSVYVLGGTSEIAEEICLNLIKNGTLKIHLVCRDHKKSIFFNKNTFSFKDVEITYEDIDLIKYDPNKSVNIPFFDLYIIAAGYLGNSNLANKSNKEALKIACINYTCLIPFLNTITSEERISKPGSLWVLTSVAGDRGRPSNYQYGAAKAALTIFCEGLLLRCIDMPFNVRIIKAGLIKTIMAKDSPEILCSSKKYLAQSLLKKPLRRGIEYFPWWWFFIMKIIKILPQSIIKRL